MSPQEQVDDFNRRYPVGTRVKAYRGSFGDEDRAVTGRTYAEASVLSDHTAVAWVEGCRGCIGLSHIVILGPQMVPDAAPAIRANSTTEG